MSILFWVTSQKFLEPKLKIPCQVQLVQILDLPGGYFREISLLMGCYGANFKLDLYVFLVCKYKFSQISDTRGRSNLIKGNLINIKEQKYELPVV